MHVAGNVIDVALVARGAQQIVAASPKTFRGVAINADLDRDVGWQSGTDILEQAFNTVNPNRWPALEMHDLHRIHGLVYSFLFWPVALA